MLGKKESRGALRAFLLAAALFFAVCCAQACFAYNPGDPEFRAFWVDAWHNGILSQSQVNTLLGVVGDPNSKGQVRDANCNSVVIQVRRNCDAAYPSGMGEPYMSGLSPSTFNGLQAAINAAHDTSGGKQYIEVHAWMVTFRTSGGKVYGWHDDTPTGSLTELDNYWPSRDNTGAVVTDKALDPGHPLVEDYTVKVAMDLVNNFDIDGIHFDYVRFTANNQGYNPTSIARYNARYGATGQPAPSDERFKQWRRDQVSSVVRKVYAQTQASKPWVKVSGSFVTWNPSPTASTRDAFKKTRPYYDVFCDWDSWLQEGIIDAAVPMTYYNWSSLPSDYTRWLNFEKDRHGNRHMYIGPGIYLNSLSNSVVVLQKTRDASPAGNYADGFCGYSYYAPYSGGTWGGFSPSLVSGLTGTTQAPVPDMPWKSAPTKGHISGTVVIKDTGAWADGATVTITGPEDRTQTCDGTGFYAFIDLTPGTYTVTATVPGYPPQTKVVTVEVGSVTGNMYVTNFALGGPIMSDIMATGLTNMTEQITWNTDRVGSTQVEYGLTAAYGSTTTLDPTQLMSHSVTIAGLTPETRYHYRVISADDDGTTVSGDYTFTTMGPPAISNVQSTALTNYGSTITWTTDQPTSTQVQYGLTATCDSTTTPNPALVTAHSAPIIGCTALTTYHYRVVSANGNGAATSGDNTFTTSGPPTVSNVVISSITSSTAIVTWTTNAPSDSKVSYGTSISYGKVASNSSLVVNHSITLTGLTPITDYHLKVTSWSTYGSYTTPDFVFKTISAPPVSDVVISNVTASSATITWNTTGQPTDSTVSYGVTTAYGSQTTDAAQVTSHSVTLTGLVSATAYHCKCLSTNAIGTGSSADVPFSTPPATDDIIIDDSNAGCTRSGFWTPASGGYLGGNVFVLNKMSSPSATCTWTPNATAGNYDVYVYYPSGTTPTTNAKYIIHGNGGDITKVLNQTTGTYQWNLLASHVPFPAGTTSYVRLTNMTGETSSATNVIADAVKFVFVGITGPPAISSIQSSVTSVLAISATITWNTDQNSSSQVQFGQTAAYGSSSPLDATEVAVHSVTLTNLMPNTTYHYRVKSNDATGNSTSEDYTFRTDPVEILMDDEGAGASPDGSWTNGGFGLAYAYKNTYKWSSIVAGDSTASYTYTPSLPIGGLYDIYTYFSAGTNRTTEAKYTINTPAGPITRFINQYESSNGTKWLLLASNVQLEQGSGGFVKVDNSGTATGAVVVADGIRWITAGVTPDVTPPSITISAPSVAQTRFGPVTYTVTYDDDRAVTGITLTNANVTLIKTGTANGTVNVTGGGTTTRTVTISNITGNGTLSISIAAGTAVDKIGNLSVATGPSEPLTVDNTPPTVTIEAPSKTLTNVGPIAFTVTYDGAQTISLQASNVTLEKLGTANGTVSVTGTGSTTRTVTISNITGDGTLAISLGAGTAVDAVGNVALATTVGPDFSVDNSTVPTASIGEPSATTTSGDPISYTITYDSADSVTLSPADITLNRTDTANGTVTVDGGGNATRTVTISDFTGSGTLGISIAAGTASAANGTLAPAAGPSATFALASGAPPVMASVTDETYTTSTTTLNATWSASNPDTDIKRYEYAVGTTQLGSDIKGWTNAGANKTASITGLSLTLAATYYVSVRAVNNSDVTSDPMSSPGVQIAQAVTSIQEAKTVADGKAVALPARVVSAVFPTAFYLEEDNRASGLRIESTRLVAIDQLIIPMGTMGVTTNGERAILNPTFPDPTTTGIPTQPFMLPAKATGGKTLGLTPGVTGGMGLNNTGLLVKVAGKVTTVVSDGFYLDDGSKLTDETGSTGIKIWTGTSGSATQGAYVAVTGVVSCRKPAATVYPQILARTILPF